MRAVGEMSSQRVVSHYMALVSVIGAAVLTCASAQVMRLAGLPSTDAVWGVGTITLVIGIVCGAGYWSKYLLAFAFWEIVYLVRVWTAEPVLPTLPYPFGQAGLFLTTTCVLALIFLLIHRNERVGNVLSGAVWKVLGSLRKLV